MSKRKPKPITSDDLYREAFRRAKEAGDLADLLPILEAHGAFSKDIPLTDYHFNMLCAVYAGANEGTRVSVCLQGSWSSGQQWATEQIAYLKINDCTAEAYAILGKAAGMLTYHSERYVAENINRFQ